MGNNQLILMFVIVVVMFGLLGVAMLEFATERKETSKVNAQSTPVTVVSNQLTQ